MKKVFCERLRMARGAHSQAFCANLLGVSQQAYASWEKGAREPNLETLAAISQHFAVSVDWLLGLRETARNSGSVIASGKNSQAAGQNIFAASAESSEVERLKGEVAALERALAMFAPKNGGK